MARGMVDSALHKVNENIELSRRQRHVGEPSDADFTYQPA
jgi:hypothetical protein